MDLAKIHKFQHQKVAHPSDTNLQLAAETSVNFHKIHHWPRESAR